MPPKTVKKTPPGPGARRGGRGGKGPNRSQNKVKPVTEEPVKVDKPVKVAEPAKVDESVKAEEPAVVFDVNSDKVKAQEEDITPASSNDKAAEAILEKEKEVKPVQEFKSVDREVIPFKKDGVKDSVDEYEKGERLDLDDNDPEYEPEEYVGVDYDEKETEQEDFQEEEDPVEGEVGEEEEEEVEMVEEEEEIEEVQEKLEGEGDDDEEDGNPVEEHAQHTQIEDHAEEEDHHDIVKERRKRKEFEVFVGGLDKDTCEDDLQKVFSAVGDVTEVRLMMNPLTLKNKGFAFIRFATVEQAKRACSELKTPVVCGKKCGVKPSQDSDTLFLGNICTTWTKEALKEKLKHYGVDNIEELTLVEDNNSEGTNRGFAFLEFSSRSEAMDAFKRLQKRDVVFGVDRPAKVSFADSFIDPGDEIMAKVKTVFVDGLLASWDEDRVRELLKAYGEIEKVELARNMPSAKRKDFGFVTFSTHDAAVICAKGINNEELGDGGNRAKVRARLSRPLERDKRKRISHADSRRGRGGGGPVRGPLLHSARGPWSRPVPRSVPTYRGSRSVPSRIPPVIDRGFKRPSIPRERRHMMAIPPRHRPVAPPPRSYPRRQPGPPYPKSSLKRGYARQEEVPPPPPPRRRAAVADYSRAPPERRMQYREDEYAPRGSAYTDLPPRGGPSRPVPRRDYADEGYEQRYERPPPPAYREERTPRDYDTIPGSKRTYSALDDVPSRYAETGVRQSRARVDYERSGSGSQYVEVDAERLPRSSLGYSTSRTRSSISSQDPRGIYGSSRQDTSYGGGSYGGGGGDVNGGGLYSSDYGTSEYAPRGSDVVGGSGGGGGGSSYSSLYSGRGFGGSGSYMGSGGSGSSYY